jgi:F420H(2)-dependent quinone reductase
VSARDSRPAWALFGGAFGLHKTIYRLSGGLIGHRVPFGPRMLLLDHVGAKSGTKRTTPLLYAEDGDAFVIVASKGGHPRHPGWYHNLRANPDTRIQVGTRKLDVTARVATAAERKRLWPKAVEVWSDYDVYQKRTDREIPLVVLEPRA